ncbi:MAG: outer membrane beta-barrel protein [Geminicoccaceae bacterium]
MIRWVVAVAAGGFLIPGAAKAEDVGLYVGGMASLAYFADVESSFGGEFGFDPAIGLSALVGYHLRPRFRVEADLSYEIADVDVRAEDAKVARVTASGYYEFLETDIFRIEELRPYIGGGVGFANVELDNEDTNELTWHIEGGVSVDLSDNWDFVPGLRFAHVFLDDENGFDSDLWITQFRAGLRYYF